jgi:F-type H+-transporting ATPase subunit delta
MPFDPAQQQLGAIYAKALLGTSEKQGNSDLVLEEFDSVIDDVLPKLPRLRAALESPRIPLEAKERILDQAFGGKMCTTLLHFLKVVCRHGRMDCLGAIHQATRQRYDELRGRVAVTVATAVPASDEMLEQIRNRLQEALGHEVVMRTRVEPELIGGIAVRVGDTVYDATVVHRLARLRSQTCSRAAHAIRDAVDRFTSPEAAGSDGESNA